MKKNKAINPGGVNGLGESLVNQNSVSFKGLRDAIKAHQAKQSESERLYNQMLGLRFQMETYLASEETDQIVPAGNFIERFLKVTGVSKKRFAEYLDYDYSNLIAVLKGRRKVNPDLAIKVGKTFGINPTIWLHIESKNELMDYLNKKADYDTYSLAGLIQ